jgi:uncharacterized membrane protein SirB2
MLRPRAQRSAGIADDGDEFHFCSTCAISQACLSEGMVNGQTARVKMLAYYPQIKLVHVAAVIASGSLLLLRGLFVQVGRRGWALAAPVRYLSYAIDTALLTAALMLVSILPLASFSNGWLLTKLLLLPVYVCLGWLALRQAGTPGAGTGFLVGAMIMYALMLAIARTHDPLGGMGAWLGAA